MTEVNVPLLRKAVEWAEAEAAKDWRFSEWNQNDWFANPKKLVRQTRDSLGRFVKGGTVEKKAEDCGTCYCIAGWVAVEAGATPSIVSGFVRTEEGQAEHASHFAAKELGLDWNQSGRLFAATNTIKDVRRIAEDIAGERL